MAKEKELDLSAFDTAMEEELDLSAFDTVTKPDTPPEEMGAMEAARLGVEEGTLLGLDEIIAGAAAAAGAATGSEQAKEAAARLTELGIKDPEGAQSLLDQYYEAKATRAGRKERAREEQFGAYMGGSLAGGMLGTGAATQAAKGLAGLGKAGAVASKALPSVQPIAKGATLGQKAGAALIEGTKAGALAGFGLGEAKLGRGEIGETLKETTLSGIAGGGLGAGLSAGVTAAGQTLKGIRGAFPGAKALSRGFEYSAKSGKKLTADNVNDDVRILAQTINRGVSKKLKEYGVLNKEISEVADELGLRVAVGETFEDIFDQLDNLELAGLGKKERQRAINGLYEILGEDPEILNKLTNQLEKKKLRLGIQSEAREQIADIKQQKQAMKEQLKSGEQPISTKVEDVELRDISDEAPLSDIKMRKRTDTVEREGQVEGLWGEKRPGVVRAEKIKVEDISGFEPSDILHGTQKDTGLPYAFFFDKNTGKHHIVVGNKAPISIGDLESLTIKKAEAIRKDIDKIVHGIEGEGVAKISDTDIKNVLLGLRSRLNDQIKKVADEAGEYSVNRSKLGSLMQARKAVGIDKPYEKVREKVMRLESLIESAGDEARKKMRNFWEDIANASPEVFGLKSEAEKLTYLKQLTKERMGGFSIGGFFAESIPEALAKVGAGVGRTTTIPKRLFAAGVEHLRKLPADKISNMGYRLDQLEKEGYKSFARALNKIAKETNERTRTALFYSLYQQPSFRKALMDIGEDVFGEEE